MRHSSASPLCSWPKKILVLMLISEQSSLSFYTDGTETIVRPRGLTFSLYKVSSHVLGHMKGEHNHAVRFTPQRMLSSVNFEWSFLYQLLWMTRAAFSSWEVNQKHYQWLKTSQISTWLIVCIILLFFVSKCSQMRGTWPNQLAGLL